MRLGNGTEDTNADGEVLLPKERCIRSTGEEADINVLINYVFPHLDAKKTDPNYMTSRAILSTRNDCVDRINMQMINLFQGDKIVYHSFDSAVDHPHNYYPSDFLNTLTLNGLPPHMLKLKKKRPVILLRNLDPASGLQWDEAGGT